MDDKKITKKINRHTIELSHVTKKLYPKSNITKYDVIQYYSKIATYFLPHVKDHLMVMHRFPTGIQDMGFYQKQVPDYFPSWIKQKEIKLKKGEKQSLVLVHTQATLVYLANQAVLVFHSWLSSIHTLQKPDKIVFDLDPADKNVKDLRFAAKKLKAILEEHELVPYIMTTGSRGYHIVIPIIPEHSFEKVRHFAKQIATELAEQYPDKCTVEMSKSKRKGRIFVDYLRNAYGQTSVACYSLRAIEGAPIATPIEWDELSTTKPQKYTLKNIFKRIAQKGDSWQNFKDHARKLRLRKE